MVVPNEFDADERDAGPVDAPIRIAGTWIVSRAEYQAPASCQIECKLAFAIALEGVGIADDKIGNASSSLQRQETQLQFAGTGGTQLLLGDSLSLAQLAKLPVPESDFHARRKYSINLYLFGKDKRMDGKMEHPSSP